MILKNYVMTHKESIIPSANWIVPLGLGGFTSETITETDKMYDENISELNRYYCELTGIFHVWKNSKAEYIGISHYRRYLNLLPITDVNYPWMTAEASTPIFDFLRREEQYDKAIELLQHYDFILPRCIHSNSSVGEDYVQAHGSHEWNKFMNVLDQKYGSQKHSMMFERRNFLCNMMITRRSIFNNYCAELFDTIDKVFEDCGIPNEIPGARYQPFRYPGYLAERFMSAFINVHRPKVYEANVITLN